MLTPRSAAMAALALLLVSGCMTDSQSMMDGMGGRPGSVDARIPLDMPDRALPVDAAPVDAAPIDAQLPDGPPLHLDDIQARGAWKSYHLREEEPFASLDFEHPPLREQLDVFGWRHLDFDIEYNPNGGFWVYNNRFGDYQSRCQGNLGDCLAALAGWSADHPDHAPIVVLFQQTSSMLPDIFGALDRLEHFILREITRERVFTPGDALAEHPGSTLREMLEEHGWPALERARGTFLFVLNDEPARESNRDWPGFGGVDALQGLLWVYADGNSEDELAADDAAIALLGELTTDEEQARARELVDRGYMVRVPAHGHDSYARAAAAGAHLISSKFPAAIFPGPGDDAGWPVSCNPVTTTPETCDPRRIERHAPPED